MAIQNPGTSSPVEQSRRSGRLLRARAVALATLLLALFLGACESGLVDSDQRSPETGKLAELWMEFDLTTGTVRTGTNSILASGSRLALLNGLMTQESVTCSGCGNGVLGMHEISSLLRNSSTATLQMDAVSAGCTYGCAVTGIGSFPSVMTSGARYTQNILVDADSAKFGVTLDIYGTAFYP